MRVLIAVASKHGATQGIGAEIARVLREAGVEADLRQIGEPIGLDGYDAVVLGSAVYMGRWLGDATSFVEEHGQALRDRPVWLFSSGPLGEPPKGSIEQRHLDQLMADTGARGHRLFSGSIDPDDLGFKERVVTKVVGAPSGDFRDWDAIGAWAREIAAALRGEASPV